MMGPGAFKKAVPVPPGPGEAGYKSELAYQLVKDARTMAMAILQSPLYVQGDDELRAAVDRSLPPRHLQHKAPEPGCDLCESALDEARELLAEQREAEREAMD